MSARSPITTHVLDTSRGRPAAGVPVTLCWEIGPDSWQRLAHGTTDADGRVADLLPPGTALAGVYRLRFDTTSYFAALAVTDYFYPWADVCFRIEANAPDRHYHVPLLLNPFGYSTYRGS